MKTIKNRYYYSVNECLSGRLDGHYHYEEFTSTTWGLFSGVPIESTMEEWASFVANETNVVANTFVTKYLALKVDDICFCSTYDKLFSGSYLNLDFKIFLSRFMEWWRDTYTRYSKLIALYAANDNNLMKGVIGSVTTTTDGNSTATTSAVPTSSTYTSYPSATDDIAEGTHDSNHSSTSVTTDNSTEDVIDHLTKVKDKVIDLYAEWLQSFVRRFIIYVDEGSSYEL